MKIFKSNTLTLLIYGSYIVSLLVGCGKISQGDQRRKFEFLYKLNNYISLTKEFSSSLFYYKDLPDYIERMIKMKSDVTDIETIKNWSISDSLKQRFIKLLDNNLKSASDLKSKNLNPDDKVKSELDVILIKERVANYTEELYKIIADVGKE